MKQLLITAALGVASVGAQAQSPEAIIDRAASRYAAMNTMRADFVQTITNPLTGTRSVSRGELLRSKPNLLAINFTDPPGDRVIADGKQVWVYLPSSAPGQVIRTPSSRVPGSIDPGGIFLTSPRSRFNVAGAGSATLEGRKTDVVILTPKAADQGITRARVWVDSDDGSVRQFEVTESSGVTRLVLITRLVQNPSIPRSAFTFTPPRGARIVDSGNIGGM